MGILRLINNLGFIQSQDWANSQLVQNNRIISIIIVIRFSTTELFSSLSTHLCARAVLTCTSRRQWFFPWVAVSHSWAAQWTACCSQHPAHVSPLHPASQSLPSTPAQGAYPLGTGMPCSEMRDLRGGHIAKLHSIYVLVVSNSNSTAYFPNKNLFATCTKLCLIFCTMSTRLRPKIE